MLARVPELQIRIRTVMLKRLQQNLLPAARNPI